MLKTSALKTLQVRSTKAQIKKWDCIKPKSLCTIKETISGLKEWEKIFANHVSRKELISQVYKELYNSVTKDNLIEKWAEDLNRHFSKGDICIANRYKERWSTSQIFKDVQVKTTVRYHLISIIVIIIEKTGSNKYWQGCGGEKGTFVCRSVHSRSHCEEQCGDTSKKKNGIWGRNSAYRYLSEESENTNLKSYMHIYVLCSIIYNWQDMLFSCSVMSDSFATPWTGARQASLSMGFSGHSYCTGLPFPSSEDLPDSGIKLVSPCLLHCRQILYRCATREAHTKRWKQSKYSSHTYMCVYT